MFDERKYRDQLLGRGQRLRKMLEAMREENRLPVEDADLLARYRKQLSNQESQMSEFLAVNRIYAIIVEDVRLQMKTVPFEDREQASAFLAELLLSWSDIMEMAARQLDVLSNGFEELRKYLNRCGDGG